METTSIINIFAGIFILTLIIVIALYASGSPPFDKQFKDPMTGIWYSEPPNPVQPLDPGNACGPYCRQAAADPEIYDMVEFFN